MPRLRQIEAAHEHEVAVGRVFPAVMHGLARVGCTVQPVAEHSTPRKLSQKTRRQNVSNRALGAAMKEESVSAVLVCLNRTEVQLTGPMLRRCP